MTGDTTSTALVCTPNEAMAALKVSRATLYHLLNTGELASFTEGKSRKIITQSLHDYVRRKLTAEAEKRNRVA